MSLSFCCTLKPDFSHFKGKEIKSPSYFSGLIIFHINKINDKACRITMIDD